MDIVFQFLAAFLPLIGIMSGICIFGLILSLIAKLSLKKHFPEKLSKVKMEFGKPIKTIKLTLIRFGNENKCYGTDYNQSIPVKLFVYERFLVFASYGQALIISDFNHKFISFIKTESYSDSFGKKIAHPREDLIIFSKICALQFLINQSDNEYLKNYIKEMQNV